MQLSTSTRSNPLLALFLIVAAFSNVTLSSAPGQPQHRRQISQDNSSDDDGPTTSSGSDISSFMPPFSNFTTSTTSLEPSIDPEPTSTITKVPLTTQVTVTHVITDAFGKPSTSIDVVPTTTMVASDDPSLASGDSSSSESGVTPQQKKIIIGVVVSVVGVLSLAGIAGLVWRIWFRGRGEGNEIAGGGSSPSISRTSVQKPGNLSPSVGGGSEHRRTASLNPSSNF